MWTGRSPRSRSTARGKIIGMDDHRIQGTHCCPGGTCMNETSNNQTSNSLEQLTEQYLGLESMEVTEELLDLCGASIDTRALPLLRRRLHEEEAALPQFEARGYVRLREKGEQLVTSLRALIAALEQEKGV